MKHLSFLIFVCFIITSSCSDSQRIEEKKVFIQVGDSCINRFYSSIKKGFDETPYPPPPPTMVLRFFEDSAYRILELNKLDTLGYPFKFSVLKFTSKNDSSVNEYYKAFTQQNELRLNYICENILIYDTLLIPSSALLAEAVRNNDTLIKEFKLDSLKPLLQDYFSKKPKEKFWEKEKLNENAQLITDLRPTSIKFYRVVFNKSKTKGILILAFNIWGYLDGFACFNLENNNSKWTIRDYHWFSVHRNEKRWKIE
jgi:hypothetical protein